MTYDQPVKPLEQPLDTGMLFRVLTMQNVTDTTNKLEPYGLSPMTGRPAVGKHVNVVMGFEGGSGISISDATQTYGKKGTLLRRKLRIDKCPWPNGEDNIRLRITITYGHTIGFSGEQAEPKVYVRKWFRNTTFEDTFESNEAGTNPDLSFYGYEPASASMRIRLEAHGVGPGFPLVQDDENGLSDTYVRCYMDNPMFSEGLTYMAMLGPPFYRDLALPCPQWVKHRVNFAEGFVGVFYGGIGSLGLVMGVGATIEAIGWDNGFWDIDGWHAGTTLDPYITFPGPVIVGPNQYVYPNYPISDPFNPSGEGVG